MSSHIQKILITYKKLPVARAGGKLRHCFVGAIIQLH